MRRAMPAERRIMIDGVSCFTGRHGGRAYWLVPTGIGPEAAQRAASAVLNRHTAALAVSAGFSGALLPAAAVGDVIVATSVVSGRFDGAWAPVGAPMACDDTVLRAVQAAAADTRLAFRSGLVVSLTTVLCRAVEKENVSRLTGAIALDMESAAIGNVARAHGIPFAVVRTVSDVASEDLPLNFNVFLTPWGWVRGVGAMIMRPSSLIGLNRLRRQSRFAAGRLTAVCAACVANGFGLSPVSKAGRA
jgi:adenosylhomocysteine nucleosidase